MKARILIADDDFEVLDCCREILAEAGHEVDVARSGDEVLERVRANKYDLLLQDLVFPPTDGVMVLEEVKRLRPTLPVVMLSGFADVDRVIDAYRAGAFDFVLKPISAEKLFELGSRAETVRELGNRRRGTLQDMERARIAQALTDAHGNKKKAAQVLGIHRSTLYDKLRRYGLPPEG
jgi:DNA-binding NtrC family response regulator